MNRRERREKRFLLRNKTQAKNKTVKVVDEVVETDDSKSIYYKHYKLLLLIPLIMFLAALVVIGINIAHTGDFINKGISFTGGTLITITKPGLNDVQIESQLKTEFPKNTITVRKFENQGEDAGITIESDIVQENQKQVDLFINKIKTLTKAQKDDINENIFGASMGESFFRQLITGIIIALLFMGFVVFLYFKTVVPSTAVILAAVSDIIVTIAIVDILGMKMGIAGITALLMLIGYSVDTDILLSSRVIKNKEHTVYKRVIDAMKTGLTMTLTTLTAVLVALLVSRTANIVQLNEIMFIVIIGLLVDLINTWIQNAGILRWYMEKKKEEENNE